MRVLGQQLLKLRMEADGVRAAARAGLMYQNISEVSLSAVRRQGSLHRLVLQARGELSAHYLPQECHPSQTETTLKKD